ncbi:hypothetical protein [Undibacterium sp. Ren11W]|uniref:hypothetical protein n=1 Tax=Undibacterium sp. Ren11W TaxID=3413045 RepID=UPI003BF17D2F
MATVKILNYELAPSPATIFGCLLPAPWLGMVAGLLLAFLPANGLPDRFAPLTLALTHCLVLGMLAPIMIGALFQLMAVVGGQTVNAAAYISPFVAIGSALIAGALCFGFLMGDTRGFMVAAGLAALLYGAVVLALASTAWRVTVLDATTRTLAWICVPLTIVVSLGIGLAGALAGRWSIDVLYWLDLHVAWGVVGWIATLVIGIAFTVVPMFWQTPKPSLWWQRSLPGLLCLPLLAMPIAMLRESSILLACLLVMAFALLAMRAVWRAKRSFDPAWILWLVCTLSWFFAAFLTASSLLFEAQLPSRLTASLPWWIGVLALVGGAVLPVNAMLGKIIPFLVFMHLRRQIPMGRRVPTMQAVLPPQRLKWQARVLLLAFLLLLLLPVMPSVLVLAAGLAFALSQGMMGALLMLCLFSYRRELLPVLMANKVKK